MFIIILPKATYYYHVPFENTRLNTGLVSKSHRSLQREINACLTIIAWKCHKINIYESEIGCGKATRIDLFFFSPVIGQSVFLQLRTSAGL